MTEKKYSISGIDVTYLYKKATHDKKHLVVIFSGFAEEYSFLNAGNSFKCNVVWIKDDYNGMECYYLGKDGELDFSLAVNSLIESLLAELDLDKKQCTLLGGSKGAFTALYFGVTFQYYNIVSSAPTLKIGDRMSRIKPDIATFMMGDKPSGYYDKLLINTIRNDFNSKKNIYLFISKDDGCYEEHQKVLIQELRVYENLNLVMINSDLVFRHNRVTAYSVPMIMAFVTSIIEGAPPTFKYIESGCKRKLVDCNSSVMPIAELDQIRIDKDNLILKGVAFCSGVYIDEGTKYEKYLRLRRNDKYIEYPLETTFDPMFGVRYFEEKFINYDFAGVVSSPNSISLSQIECGVYQLYAFIKLDKTREFEHAFMSKNDLDLKFINDGFEYRIWKREERVLLSKRTLLSNLGADEEVFELSVLEVKDTKFFIRGRYVIPGIELENWGDAKYYLVLSDNKKTHSFRLGLENDPNIDSLVAEGFGVYQKSCFATIRHQGVELKELLDGSYDIYVILSYKGTLFRKKIDKKIIKNNEKLIFSFYDKR